MAKYKLANRNASGTTASRRRASEPATDGPVGAAEARIRADGMRIPDRPGEEVPGLPADLTSLGDKDLMAVMREQIAWVEYTGYRLARGEIEERDLELHINQRSAMVLFSNWGGGSDARVAVSKAQVEVDSKMKAMRDEHMKAQAYRKIVQNLYDAAERRVSLVSRELSRRISMEPYQKRAHRHGGA